MNVWQAFEEGCRRVLRAPALVIGTWLATFAVALPLTLVLHGEIAAHFGSSAAAAAAVEGINSDWWGEFLAQASSLGQTFVPAILGFAAVLSNFGQLADAQPQPLVIAIAVSVHLMLSLFLLGGVLDRLARDRPLGAYGFFALAGGYWLRLLRLAILAGLVYWALFGWLHPWLFDRVLGSLTRDLTVERTAALYRGVFYLAFGAVVAAVNLVFDYAKIRMVVEDRLSATGAVAAALRFIRRHPGAAVGLYLVNTVIFLVVIAGYAALARVPTSPAQALLALTIGQLYLVVRVLARLTFAASQIALFQSRLAHHGYTARRIPVWPESAAAELIRPEPE
jgi:hypothetical protein